MKPEQKSDLQAIADGRYWKRGQMFNPLVALAQAVLELDAKANHPLYCIDGGPDPVGLRLEPMFGEATATGAALSINALATASATAPAVTNRGSINTDPFERLRDSQDRAQRAATYVAAPKWDEIAPGLLRVANFIDGSGTIKENDTSRLASILRGLVKFYAPKAMLKPITAHSDTAAVLEARELFGDESRHWHIWREDETNRVVVCRAIFHTGSCQDHAEYLDEIKPDEEKSEEDGAFSAHDHAPAPARTTPDF